MAVRSYRIADLALESPIAFPELPPAPAGRRDWTVAVERSRRRTAPRWSHHWREADGRLWLSIGRAGDEHVLRFARTASFRVSLGRRRITCEGASLLPADTLRHLLLNQVLPLALGSDRIVLHASAVRLWPGVVAFAGPGGAGKSTLAAALCRAGAAFVTDDAVIVERAAAGCRARAIYGSLRLWPDAAGALFGPRLPPVRVAHYTRKRRIEMGHADLPDEPAAPLAAVCVLDGTRGRSPAVSLERLPARDAMVALTTASFHLDIHDRERWKRVIDDLAHAAESIPVFALSYPKRMPRLAATAREILERLATAIPGR